MSRRRSMLCAALLLAGCASAPSPQTTVSDPGYDVAVGVASFEMSWDRIRETHFNADQLDWEAIHTEFLPLAEQARSNDELRGVIADMLDRLGQSHFEVMPPMDELSAAVRDQSGDPGLDVRWVDDELLVSSVRTGSPADRAGVTAGWVVEEIDGRTRPGGGDSARSHMATHQRALGRLRGAVGSAVVVRMRNAERDEVELSLLREDRPGQRVQIAGLPEFWADVTAEQMIVGESCVGFLQFDIWMPPIAAKFPAALQSMQDCDGMVIDLRGNAGGVGALAKGLAGYLVQEPGSLGTMTSRDNVIEFTIYPRPVDAKQGKRNFTGPVAILMDALSASTSEIFAVGMQEIGRARTFGSVTAGMALPAITETLPNGDTLLHAVADFATPLGNPLEGRGVQPDVPVALDRDTMLSGEDPVLAAALQWIQTTLQTESHQTEGSME